MKTENSDNCIIPENNYTSPTEGIFSKTFPPPTHLEIPILASCIFLIFFLALQNPSPPRQEIPIPLVGGSMEIFWNSTMLELVKILTHLQIQDKIQDKNLNNMIWWKLALRIQYTIDADQLRKNKIKAISCFSLPLQFVA